MNKAITEGLQLRPPAFADGLGQWSSGDGTPGSDTYEGAANAAYVPGDADFGGCLELQKTEATQRLRYMGQVPIQAGCYLQVRARVKAVSGNLPSVRIAAWAGNSGGAHVTGLTETAGSVSLTSYGEIVEVTGIIGTGARGGVDMVWSNAVSYAHVGLDLTGPSGGVVRIDDLEVVDITSAFLRDMMAMVDVRDFGAVGDGLTDDTGAFQAADAAANGREILVPAGSYLLSGSVSFANPVRFEGTVTMPRAAILALTKNFDLPTYINAFGNEQLAFEKAFQALFNNADHESLDLGGRRITIDGPMDLQAIVPNVTSFAQRRHILNGQFYVRGDTVWNNDVVTSSATYAASNPRVLTAVGNIANVDVGARVTGNGVGREVYVQSKDEVRGELTLSSALYDAEGTQVFTFTRHKYVLDFSGFTRLTRFVMSNIEIVCDGRASGILLPPAGHIFHMRDCWISRPLDKAITSHGEGCQGMLIDRCNFESGDGGTLAQDRRAIVLNANANDVKLRNNRASQFRHFAVLGGSNATVIGNHFFQGDSAPAGLRTAGVLLTRSFCSTTISGNYVDNCSIEWSNEHTATPDQVGFSFASLSITDNVFLCSTVAPWFGFISIKPYGSGHYIGGLTVTGNKFRALGGDIDQVDVVDTSFAALNMNRAQEVLFAGNSFHNVTHRTENPLTLAHDQNTAASTWVVDTAGRLPFGGRARQCRSVVATAPLRTGGGVTRFATPYASLQQGSGGDQIHLHWPEALRGDVTVQVSME